MEWFECLRDGTQIFIELIGLSAGAFILGQIPYWILKKYDDAGSDWLDNDVPYFIMSIALGVCVVIGGFMGHAIYDMISCAL